MASNILLGVLRHKLAKSSSALASRSVSQLAEAAAASSPRPHLDGKPARDDAKQPQNTATSDVPTSQIPPYSVARNSQGSLPVYSDIRNGGSRYLVLVRNVKGNVNVSHLLFLSCCKLSLDINPRWRHRRSVGFFLFYPNLFPLSSFCIFADSYTADTLLTDTCLLFVSSQFRPYATT